MIMIHRQPKAKVRRFTHLATTCSMGGDQWAQIDVGLGQRSIVKFHKFDKSNHRKIYVRQFYLYAYR